MRTERRRPLWVYWVLAFVVLQLLDGVLTSVGMHRYRPRPRGESHCRLHLCEMGRAHGSHPREGDLLRRFLWDALVLSPSEVDGAGCRRFALG